MKSLIPSIILFWLMLFPFLTISSCSTEDEVSSGSDQKEMKAFTESNLVSDHNITVKPGDAVVLFMEAYDARETSDPDTGNLGKDVIPVEINKSAFYTYRFSDVKSESAIREMTMLDASDAVFRNFALSGNFSGADLRCAHIYDSQVSAIFIEADLSGAILTGTIMPDGTVHP